MKNTAKRKRIEDERSLILSLPFISSLHCHEVHSSIERDSPDLLNSSPFRVDKES